MKNKNLIFALVGKCKSVNNSYIAFNAVFENYLNYKKNINVALINTCLNYKITDINLLKKLILTWDNILTAKNINQYNYFKK